jgi:ADP-ribosylglycohydrolase
MKDRCRGALIGLAVGDALGAAVEFSSPGSFVPVTGYRSGGPHGLRAGEWTDDTSMALALADSIASAGWDLNDQAARYVQWWQTGKYSVNGRCFDIGITTGSALSRFLATKNALTSGDPSERASGNGSIMRLAPVPMRFAGLYPGKVEEIFRARLSSATARPGRHLHRGTSPGLGHSRKGVGLNRTPGLTARRLARLVLLGARRPGAHRGPRA